MRRTFVSSTLLVLLIGLACNSGVGVSVEEVKATGAIYIRVDGSVDPPDAPVHRDADLYTLTDNVTSSDDGITIERDNITLDGAGYIVQGNRGFIGIYPPDRSNVTIRNIKVEGFIFGIYFTGTSNSSIVGSNIAKNEFGIFLTWSSRNNSIVENRVTANTQTGVHLALSSNNNSIIENTFVDDGLNVFDSHENVVENNTVNSKPLVYLEGVSNRTVDEAGQVVLIGCDNIQVEGLNLSNASIGLQLWGTNNSRISGNNVNNGWHGISCYYSTNNSVTGNKMDQNGEYGLLLSYCQRTHVVGNDMTENRIYGFYLEFSSNISTVGNTVSQNSYGGIGVHNYCSYTSIRENNIAANNHTGVMLGLCSNTEVFRNNITDNGIGISFEASQDNSIVENTFVGDGLWVKDSSKNRVENNTVNGKPLVYLEGKSDYTVTDGGQVLLINCSNTRVENLNLSNTAVGLELSRTNNSKITNNTIVGKGTTSNYQFGIWLLHCSNNSVIGNTVTRNWYAIYLDSSLNNSMTANTIAENNEGIALDMASNYNRIFANNLTANEQAVNLANSQYNKIFSNSISKNKNGISVSTKNDVYGNFISENNETGISVDGDYNNIFDNNVTGNDGPGVWIYGSNWNSIVRNSLINNTCGISISFTTPERPLSYEYNTITENNIIANRYAGITLDHSSNGRIYHNNFVDNAKQAVTADSPDNVWDDYPPSGGNYWSDYNGVDSNRDGIGDTSYVVNTSNFDNYPLMGMFSSYDVSHIEQGLTVNLISNSTISHFNVLVPIEHPENRMILFTAAGESGIGFARICVPHALMNEPYKVSVNGEEPQYVNYTLFDNGTYRWIYFSYYQSTREIIIIEEFPSFLVLPLFMAPALLAVVVKRKKSCRMNA